MYCPGCGAVAEEENRHCNRCGTNLAVVSGILRGRFSAPAEVDERVVSLLKDVYRGRRSALAGGLVSLVSLGKLAPILLFGLASFTTISILLLPFLIAGLTFLIWGLVKWNNASSEIKALKHLSAGQFSAIPPARRQITNEPFAVSSESAVSTGGLIASGPVASNTAELGEPGSQPPPRHAKEQ